MKYLKSQNLSKYSPTNKTFIVKHPTAEVNIESKSSIKMPIGEQEFRPYYPVEGMVRFNSSTNAGHDIGDTATYWDPTRPVGFEVYYEGQWYPVRLQGPAKIVKDDLGVGNWDAALQPNEDLSKYFPISGEPLTYVPGLAYGLDPLDYVDNMIVIVENVIQISGTNFDLVESDGIVVGVEVVTGGLGLAPSSSIPVTFSAPDVAGTTATGVAITDGAGEVTEINVTDPGSGYTGASTPTVTVPGEIVAGTYTVKLAKPGWHLKFLSAVPDSKPVIVFYGYDQ